MDFLYDTGNVAGAFGAAWCGPSRLEHGKPALVAVYPAENADGARVEVFCTAIPAMFYRLQVAATLRHPAYAVTTGSGQASWSHHTAVVIAQGMVGFETTPN